MISPLLTALLIALVLNLLVFLIAFKKQTDKLTDITYSLTFVVICCYMWYSNGASTDLYNVILLFMVAFWAIRLGSYLFFRVLIKGKDHRFDAFRHEFPRYIRFWILQGVSAWLIALPVLIALGKDAEAIANLEGHPLVMVGMIMWVVGFLIESIADRQKFKFRLNPNNNGKFMNKGLFSVVRYPNYLGEMLVWIGVFLAVVPLLHGIEWISIISPLWVCTLLLFISGIPFLERSNKKRYAHLPEFQEYKSKTKM